MMPAPSSPLRFLTLCAALATWSPAVAQGTPTEPAAPAPVAQEPIAPPAAATPHFVQLRYPRDKDRVVAVVDAKPICLGDVVQHIDERHSPGFAQYLLGPDGKGSAEGTRILESDLIAPWVRHLADIRALEAEGKSRGVINEADLDDCLSKALKSAFEEYLAAYVADLERGGHPTQLSAQRTKRLLADFQMRHGLSCEAQGWMDYLAPARSWTNDELNAFFQDHPRYFGGGVKIAHILIQNRDAGTGILLADEGRIRAASRLEAVRAQLLPDGSNFEDLARKYSDDIRTGTAGGVLESIERFDQRMPTAICRAAWSLADGQVSDVIESQYGWHLVKRLEHVQRMLMMFSDATLPLVRKLMHREEQEELIFTVRAKYRVELKL